MEKVGKIVKAELITNYRDGLGADDKSFPSLKKSSINTRRSVALHNRTDASYKGAGFSNITLTGRFARRLTVLFKGKGRFDLFFKGFHAPYKASPAEVNDDGVLPIRKKRKKVKNSIIAGNLQRLGYDLYGFTNKAQERIRNNFVKYLRRRK